MDLEAAKRNFVSPHVCTRLRRAEVGTHHHIAGMYLGAYAAEMAWRQDTYRKANGTQFTMAIRAVATASVSRQWAGYWQRHTE